MREKQDQVGWTLVEDPVMVGVRLGIPARLAPRKERGRTGGRWTSSRGEVQIETFRDSIADTTFAALFEQQKRARPDGGPNTAPCVRISSSCPACRA